MTHDFLEKKQIIDEFKLTEQKNQNEKENKNGKLGNVQEVL